MSETSSGKSGAVVAASAMCWLLRLGQDEQRNVRGIHKILSCRKKYPWKRAFQGQREKLDGDERWHGLLPPTRSILNGFRNVVCHDRVALGEISDSTRYTQDAVIDAHREMELLYRRA